MEIEQVPHKVLPDPVLHPQDLGQSASILRTPLDDPSVAHPFIHSTGIESLRPTAPIGSIPAGLAGDPRFQSPSIQSTPAGSKRGRSPSIHSRHSVDPHGLDRSPPPLQRQDRIRRPGWKMGNGSDRPRTGWSSQKQNWSDEDLTVVRGQLPLGNLPWHNVDSVLIPCNLGRTHWVLASIDLTAGNIYLFDPYRQEVPFSHRKM
ncbi:hypothetical protein LWI28_019242 [Acer negundo]|uniref:Ubiquitin-like protease family profile domain-containing protein n=1 Tax=Acer negundo TaxID=4023 RepID=A0AAD5NQE8_ACENE|nr:hypothetical protein LWI28_019242 [Acer negundo]